MKPPVNRCTWVLEQQNNNEEPLQYSGRERWNSMGIIKAAISSIGSGFADQWLEYIRAGKMDDRTVMSAGVAVRGRDRRNANTSDLAYFPFFEIPTLPEATSSFKTSSRSFLCSFGTPRSIASSFNFIGTYVGSFIRVSSICFRSSINVSSILLLVISKTVFQKFPAQTSRRAAANNRIDPADSSQTVQLPIFVLNKNTPARE